MKYIPSKKILLAGFGGVAIGLVTLLAIRFVTYAEPEPPHYHANFAVYVNGAREQFKGLNYYEETAAEQCTLHPIDSPKERAHMHDNINDVVHIEDHLVTWGDLMQNLGWGIGDDYIKTTNGVLINGDSGKLDFVLNGKPADSIYGKIIGDKDTLLISYGNDDAAQLQTQFKSIASTATKYDNSKDPASCGAGHSSNATTSERLHHLF